MTREQESILETREHRVLVRLFAFLVFLIGLVVFVPIASFAAEHGHEAPSIKDTLFYWINFLTYIAIMYFLLRKTLSHGWDSRRETIRAAADRGKIAAEAAQAELRNIEAKLKNLPTEIAAIKEAIVQETASEVVQVERDAKEAVNQIAAHTQSTIVAERKALERDVRRELASIVMAKVEQKLAGEMTSEKDAGLRRAAVGSARILAQ